MRMPKERYIGLGFFSGELKPRQRKPYAIVMTMGEKKAFAAQNDYARRRSVYKIAVSGDGVYSDSRILC